MTKFYSSNQGWFGAAELRADYEAAGTWPADAQEITDEEEAAIRAAMMPPAPALADLKVIKLGELSAAFSERMLIVKVGYPPDEIQSWFDQKSEAAAYTANASAPTPLLSAMAAARGITVADLAARVLVNAEKFATAAGTIIGQRQKHEDAVNAASDAASVAAVTWVD